MEKKVFEDKVRDGLWTGLKNVFKYAVVTGVAAVILTVFNLGDLPVEAVLGISGSLCILDTGVNIAIGASNRRSNKKTKDQTEKTLAKERKEREEELEKKEKEIEELKQKLSNKELETKAKDNEIKRLNENQNSSKKEAINISLLAKQVEAIAELSSDTLKTSIKSNVEKIQEEAKNIIEK